MNKKSVIAIVSVIILVMITLSITIIIQKNRNDGNDNPSNNNEVYYDGENGNQDGEDFYDYETILNEKALEIFATYFPDGYDFEYKDGVYEISLNDLGELGANLSDFVTDEYFCSLAKSFVRVELQENGFPLRGSSVSCFKR